MSTIRIYSLQDKQKALECFASGMSAAQTHERLKFSYATLRKWHHLFQANDLSWAVSDDKQFIERQKALALFQEGRGYKFVASALGVSQSRTKYWMHMFKNGQLSFFFEGSKRPKCYDETFRNQILRLFSQTTQSKKAFSYRVGISVGVLKKWLKEEALKAND